MGFAVSFNLAWSEAEGCGRVSAVYQVSWHSLTETFLRALGLGGTPPRDASHLSVCSELLPREGLPFRVTCAWPGHAPEQSRGQGGILKHPET